MDNIYFQCFKAFLAIFCVVYIPGLLFFPFFTEGYVSYYNYTGGLYLNSFILISIFLFLTFICFYYLDKIPYFKLGYLNPSVGFSLLFIIIVLYFAMSVNFSINFTSSFRHKNRLSNGGALVTILFFLKPVVYFVVSLMLIHLLNGFKLGKYSKFLLFLVLFSSVLSLNSSLQFIIIPIILMMLLAPQSMTKKFNDFEFRYLAIVTILLPIVACGVIFIGIGNKVGYEYLLSREGGEYLLNYGNTLFPRMSTSLFSSVVLLNNTADGLFYSGQTIDGISATLINRLSLLLPLESFDSSLIQTVNRINYLEVFRNHTERAGASPGIISSVFYTPLFPFTIIIIPLYVAFIFRALRFHMEKTQFNFLSILIFPYLILNLFESPLNILYLIDPVFVLFITVVFFGRFINVSKVFSK